MEIESIEEGFVKILLYPETAMRIGEACTRGADDEKHTAAMLTLGSALQAAAMAAWVADSKHTLASLREQLRTGARG